MNIYLLSQNNNNDYDTHDSMVVAAESEDVARLMHPQDDWNADRDHWKRKHSTWCERPDQVIVELIGHTGQFKHNYKHIILASFNAG